MLLRHCNALRAVALGLAGWTLATAAPAMAASAARTRSVETMPCHGAPTPYRLLVTTEGVKSNHGYLVANLYGPDKRRWLAWKGWITVQRDPAIPGDETMCLYLPGPGQYALVMFHDANANGNLDQGPFGIPTEGYGFSNNIRPFLGPPSVKSALFPAGAGDTHVTIRLHYPPTF